MTTRTQENICFRPRQLSQVGKQPINSVCLSPKGTLILSGGDDGLVNIWEVPSGDLKQSILVGGAVLAMRWIDLHSNIPTFVAGITDGSIMLFYSKSEQFKLAIKSCVCGPGDYMNLDFSGNRIAVIGEGGLHIQSIRLSSQPKGDTNFVISEIPIPNVQVLVDREPYSMHPRTVHFIPQTDSLLVSFVDSDIKESRSRLAIFRIQPWQLTKVVEINRRIGFSALSDDGSTYAFTNLFNGIDLYSPTTLTHLSSIMQAIDRSNNLALGLVIVGNTYIISGGSNGTIWMYNRITGGLVTCLRNLTSSATIQAVTAQPGPCRSLIASGSIDGNVCLWEWEKVMPLRQVQGILPSRVPLSVVVILLLLYVPTTFLIHKIASIWGFSYGVSQ